MSENLCQSVAKCPIFQQGVLYSAQTGQTYKNLYCLKHDGFKECKRYAAAKMSGLPIPASIMPNTKLSVEEIIAKLKTIVR